MHESYVTQVREADDRLQAATAKHYENLAEVRQETDRLKTQVSALMDTYDQDAITIPGLTSDIA